MAELLDFEEASVLIDFEPPNPSVLVRGTLPVKMRVELRSSTDGGIVEPDYWPAELLGFREEVEEQVEIPFEIQVPLRDLSLGKKGIAVIGKSRSKDLDVPGRA
jgi:hypothetical protein